MTIMDQADDSPFLRLSIDILREILDHFIHIPEWHERYPQLKLCRESLQVIQNLRLVCRSLNHLVSPLLCPIVHISLRQSSLDAMQGLCANPLIATGIRGAAISLAFRPRHPATSLAKFKAYADHRILNDAVGEVCNYTRDRDYEDDDNSDEAVHHRECLSATNALYDLDDWWDHCVYEDGLEDELELASQRASWDEDYKEHADILLNSYETYVTRQVEQWRLASNGTFVHAVVSALSRCSQQGLSLWLTDFDFREDEERYDAVKLAHDPRLIGKQLQQTLPWSQCARFEFSTGVRVDDIPLHDEIYLPVARLLVDFPLDCDKADLRLRSLWVDCFPLGCSLASVFPPDAQLRSNDTSSMDRLVKACRHLETFGFTRYELYPQYWTAIVGDSSWTLDTYLGAACSGRQLQSLSLDIRTFGKIDRIRADGSPGRMYSVSLGPILRRMTASNLQHVYLYGVEVDGNNLTDFIGRLSSCRLQKLDFSDIKLLQGRWLDITNKLHDLILAPSQLALSSMEVDLRLLYGAEFSELMVVRGRFRFLVESRFSGVHVMNSEGVKWYQRSIVDWIMTGGDSVPNPLQDASDRLAAIYTFTEII